MPNEELFIRQIASRAHLDSHSLQGGYISERDWGRVAEAINALAESSMFVDETPGITAFEVRSRARRLKAEHGLDLLIIDYLQLMGTSGRHDNRTLEIGAITGALKGLAKELKIPILLLSQLSRDNEKRGGRPKLSDLRDSGSIEQDADIVLFLYRAEEATRRHRPDHREAPERADRHGEAVLVRTADAVRQLLGIPESRKISGCRWGTDDRPQRDPRAGRGRRDRLRGLRRLGVVALRVHRRRGLRPASRHLPHTYARPCPCRASTRPTRTSVQRSRRSDAA
jgi:hypothetical protein